LKVDMLANLFGAAWIVVAVLFSGISAAQQSFIVLASTTSTDNSGLFSYLLPRFTAQTGITVRVVAQGTGQALKTAEHGDADVVLVHDPGAEEAFVANGYGIERRRVMYNDFIIVGPKGDPATIKGMADAVGAFSKIERTNVPFVSRGDDSGTYALEQRLWMQAGIDPRATGRGWYREAGSGMGAVLNTAAAMDAYTLSDRATWLSFKNRRNLMLIVQGDPRLFNQYSVILTNPARHPHVKAVEAKTFSDWIASADGQSTIAAFKVNGEQLFFPNAEGPAHGRS
jgi:tungstate transport system substrate-binding protein